MAKRVGVDKWLFGVVVVLVLFGLVSVFSASAVKAQAENGSAYYYVTRQALFALGGVVALIALMQVDYRHYNNPRVVFPLIAVTAMLLMAVFATHPVNGAHRWFAIGHIGFQPSELAKPAIILFLSYFLQSRLHCMDDWRGTVLRAAAPPLLLVLLIVVEPDLGTVIVCVAVATLMLYLAGMQMRVVWIAGLCAMPILYYELFHVAYRRARMMAWLNPEADPLGKGFQTMQSKIAVGTGGFFGHGLMEGVQKLFYLPEPHSDFIFANISEELGLIGALALVALFVMLGYRGMRAAFMVTDPFGRFLAFGITATVLIQAFFNMSVVLSLVPNKGITLPFVSYGGTSIFFMLVMMGVLLNITREID